MLSLYTFEKSVFIFQYFNDKILNYVLFDITVNFVNQKLKKHTHFPHNLYKLSKAKFSRFDRTRGDKNQIFRTYLAPQF